MNVRQSAFKQKPFILIVDDVPKNLQFLGRILNSKGYSFAAATSGEQALKIVERRLPDLILLDIMMPKMDGYEVCEKLKSSPKTKDIPVIFLTARIDPQDIVKGFEAGGIDYITKPFNSTELLARIKTHLEIIRISNERKELLHVLCHDLLNIFHPIFFGLRGIQDYAAFERLKEHLIAAAASGIRVIDLVREMRALEEKKADLNLRPVHLKRVVNESAFLLKHKFDEKNIELITQIDDELAVYAEYTSLVNSVINNILTNAIKFSFPSSKIIINATQKDDTVTISIKDFGIGMPEQLQRDIFDMKKNTTRKGTNGEQGTGFGLPLVKKFVDAYGGMIEVFSKEEEDDPQDHGTEMQITLKVG